LDAAYYWLEKAFINVIVTFFGLMFARRKVIKYLMNQSSRLLKTNTGEN